MSEISKAQAIEAFELLAQYFNQCARKELASPKMSYRYSDKAYDFEVSARTLEKTGPNILV